MASLRRYLLLISAISAQTLQNGFLDPVSMYLLTNKGASSDISLLMLMQNARFGSDYGINPMLLNALLTDKNGDQTKNDDLAKLILISGMNAQYSNVDFANSLPLILMMNNDGTEENMSPLLFAAFSTRFSGQNGGPEQWALMKYLAKRDHERQASCQANIGGVPTDCKCKSKFAEFELFMPDTDEGFFDLVGLLDEVECTTDAGQPCFCCYETTGQMELIMEFMLQPQQNNQNQANSWVELFKYKQDNKCSIVNDDNGDQCYCKYKRMPMMNQNPMYAFFFNQHECRKDDGVKCTACKNCDNLGQDLQSMMPFLLTGAFDNPKSWGGAEFSSETGSSSHKTKVP